MKTISMKLAVMWGKGVAFRTMLWNIAEADDGIPNFVVCQGKKDVVNQGLEEDKPAVPQPPRQRVRHRPPATEPGSSSPLAVTLAIPFQCPDNRRRDPTPFKVASLRSTAKAGRKRPASLEQAGSSSSAAAVPRELNFCVEMTAAASFIPPSSRM